MKYDYFCRMESGSEILALQLSSLKTNSSPPYKGGGGGGSE